MADREFLFEYGFAGARWGITIHAADEAEAREKIKSVAFAQYKGEAQAYGAAWGCFIDPMAEA